jgi:hypothetical protein
LLKYGKPLKIMGLFPHNFVSGNCLFDTEPELMLVQPFEFVTVNFTVKGYNPLPDEPMKSICRGCLPLLGLAQRNTCAV